MFSHVMSHDINFPFDFLQAAGEGSKLLIIPAQSTNFRWTGQQVARLAGQKETIYIIAKADMPSLHTLVSRFFIFIVKRNVLLLYVLPSFGLKHML